MKGKYIPVAILFLIFLFNSTQGWSNPIKHLGKNAQVSVITTSPGEDLYTVFGHAAIRIKDSLSGIDLVYGYGEFDFNTPNFYPEFVRGTLLYTISRDPFPLFFQEFLSEPYEMKEDILDLDSIQKQKIFDILETNYLPENKLYRYDFFFDNCATRVRDVVNKSTPYSQFFSRKIPIGAPSFRDLLKTYLLDRPWIRFGTDLILGMPADKKLSPFEETFLPYFLSHYLKEAKLPSQKPLVKEERLLLPTPKKEDPGFVLSPQGAFWILFFLSFLSLLRPSLSRILAGVYFLVFGFLGIIILYLWIGTDRTSYGLNLNILWASPLLVIIPFLPGRIKDMAYLLSASLILVLYILIPFHFQTIPLAAFPISLLLLLFLLRPLFPYFSHLLKEK